MKLLLLLVILGATIAANGNAIQVNDSLSAANIKRIGEELLKQVKSIKEEAEQIHEDTAYAISVKLKSIPEIKKVGEQYIRGLIKKSMSLDCAVDIDEHYIETVETIYTDVLKKTLKNINSEEDNLKLQKEFDLLETTLEQNLDQEVTKCVQDSKTCSITGELSESTERMSRFLDLIKQRILSDTENEVSSEYFQDKVKTYLATVPKCLTENIKSVNTLFV